MKAPPTVEQYRGYMEASRNLSIVKEEKDQGHIRFILKDKEGGLWERTIKE